MEELRQWQTVDDCGSLFEDFLESSAFPVFLEYLQPREALMLAQTSGEASAAVGECRKYWHRCCSTVMNMRGQKVKPWIDYRRMYIATRWTKMREKMWTAEDQKHWSRIYRRKKVVDEMEAVSEGRYEVECLREVIRKEAEGILQGDNTQFFIDLSRHICQDFCSCKKKPSKEPGVSSLCPSHDKDIVRQHMQDHMAPWMNDSQRLASTKEYCKTVKLFEDRVRSLLRSCGRLDIGLQYKLATKTLVYDKSDECLFEDSD